MRKPYPSDLTDERWAIVEPLVPVKKKVGRPRTNDMREVVNALLYLNRSGCQWDMLPHDLLPKSTVYNHFAQWRRDGTWKRILEALGLYDRTSGNNNASLGVVGSDRHATRSDERGTVHGNGVLRRLRLTQEPAHGADRTTWASSFATSTMKS